MLNGNYKKKNLIINLSKKTGYSINFSKKLVDDLIEILVENISKGNLNLKNIGTFNLINKKKRIGRNPKTKETKIISSREVVLFKPSKEFKEFVNLNNNE